MIKVGVSACLMGQNVRYDGKNKFIDLKNHFDSSVYELISICPEVEMGMPIPRPPMQLINNETIKLVQVDDHNIDHTKQMEQWFYKNQTYFKKFAGFILKSKSPSCGHHTTPHFKSGTVSEISDGLFVNLLKKHNPGIQIIDENHLSSFLM